MDKGAKILRDAYGISYTEGLRVKNEVMQKEGFGESLASLKALGKTFSEALVELSKELIDRDFEEIHWHDETTLQVGNTVYTGVEILSVTSSFGSDDVVVVETGSMVYEKKLSEAP